ncbi:MAG: hypothetical protein V1799_10665 [bacterium]
MVAFFIFSIHIIGLLYAFFSRRKEGLSEGLLAVGLVVLVFAIGWTISTLLTKLIFHQSFFIQQWYDAPSPTTFIRVFKREINFDTVSLLLLTFGEVFFYYFILKEDKTAGNREKGADGETRS